MRYFLIRDDLETNHVIAIHRILDSAMACFEGYIRSGDYEDQLELVYLDTDEFGKVVDDEVVVSYNKRMRSMSYYRKDLIKYLEKYCT